MSLWENIIIALIPFAIMLALWIGRQSMKSVVEDMLQRVDERTVQIQPGYRNGGESLADMAHQVVRVHDRMDALHEKVNSIARDVSHVSGRFEQHLKEQG